MANKKEINAAVDRIVIRLALIAGLGWMAFETVKVCVKMSQKDPGIVEIERSAERIGAAVEAAKAKHSSADSTAVETEEIQYQSLKAEYDRTAQEITDHCKVIATEGWSAQTRFQSESFYYNMRKARQAVLDTGRKYEANFTGCSEPSIETQMTESLGVPTAPVVQTPPVKTPVENETESEFKAREGKRLGIQFPANQ
jgi:hypothetical protein